MKWCVFYKPPLQNGDPWPTQYLHIKALTDDGWFATNDGNEAITEAALVHSEPGEYIAWPVESAVVAENVRIIRQVDIGESRKGNG